MTDYSKEKVPDLKKILQERGLVQSGNKADLIARLQEFDKKTAGGAEDEIDWEEDAPATSAPAATVEAAGGLGPVDTPVAVPNQQIDVDPSTTTDLNVVAEGEPRPEVSAQESATEAPAPEEPKQDFSIGLEKSDADKEAEKRAARLKRFGSNKNLTDEQKKLEERAKKFGTDAKKLDAVITGLDSALSTGRPKRGRGGDDEKQGGPRNKRQTPDRRDAGRKVAEPKKMFGSVKDDPVEKAKAEARAKRFAKPEVAAAST